MKSQRRPGQVRQAKEGGLLNNEKRHSSPGSYAQSKGANTKLCTIALLSGLALLVVIMLGTSRSSRDSLPTTKEDAFPNDSHAAFIGGNQIFGSLGSRQRPVKRGLSSTSKPHVNGDDGSGNQSSRVGPQNDSQSDRSQAAAKIATQIRRSGNFGSLLGEGSKIFGHSTSPPSENEAGKQARESMSPLLELDDLPALDRFGSAGVDTCDPRFALIRLYMYELGGEYNFGILNQEYMLRRPQNISDIPRYRGGMHLQHSPEFWLTVDLLTSRMEDRTWPCVAVRVFDPANADLIWVPFFSSMAYNRYTNELNRSGNRTSDTVDQNEVLQTRLLGFLHQHKLWKKSGGRDHVIVVHHPNSMHVVREQLGTAILILADFGRYNASLANVEKDVIAPYKHIIPTFENDENDYKKRPTLLFFQGMIVRKDGGVIRQQLYHILHNETGVHFTTGNTQKEGINSATEGMRDSRFCLHLAGDTPSSNRLFDAIVSHCVPVIISDEIELPFEDFIDYSEFSIFVRANDSLIPGNLISLLQDVEEKDWTAMWKRLKEIDVYFEYTYPSRPYDATSMLWRALAKKIPGINFSLHRGRRYERSSIRFMNQWKDSSNSTVGQNETAPDRGQVLATGGEVLRNVTSRRKY